MKSRPADAREEEITRLRAKVGELTMDSELLYARIDRVEGGSALRRGGRIDEPGPLALRQNAPWPGARVSRMAGAAFDGVSGIGAAS